MLYDEKVAKGQAQPTTAAANVVIAALTRPSALGLSIPAAQILQDICFDCGREYVFRIQELNIPITPEIMAQITNQLKGMAPKQPK